MEVGARKQVKPVNWSLFRGHLRHLDTIGVDRLLQACGEGQGEVGWAEAGIWSWLPKESRMIPWCRTICPLRAAVQRWGPVLGPPQLQAEESLIPTAPAVSSLHSAVLEGLRSTSVGAHMLPVYRVHYDCWAWAVK